MPDSIRQIERLLSQTLTNTKLNANEKERRRIILEEVLLQAKQKELPTARANPLRARQFMPFAALKGYHELAYENERVTEPRRAMTDELSTALSKEISRLSRGSEIFVEHYDAGSYLTTCGTVTEIETTFRFLCIEGKKINFDDVFSLGALE